MNISFKAKAKRCCISFEGAGGHVTISVVDQGKHCEVTADTREFEHPVRQFLEKI